MYKTQMKFHKD